MRHPIARIAKAALAVPLTGAMLLAAGPALATTIEPAEELVPFRTGNTDTAAATLKVARVVDSAQATQADQPYSSFKVELKAPKKVRAGGTVTYSIKATNLGPHAADAYFIGGRLPKGISGKVTYWGPDGTKCDWDDTGFWCWGDWVLKVGKTDSLKLSFKLKKSAKGSASAKLGVETYDVPTGAEEISREELERIGAIKGWDFTRTVKTKIVRK
ncbi:hypothetical protein [Spongiactinospora sp. TRM90649]|uniref:hypothetical protein n=1 Tax=Spongiactinospora sp. TRM90649 TaxID=3031114 RepID=UPI0023F9D2F6|nr:hypothetical protein [Spongiactinospora sp. TRM90649]MDF5754880.1 hypothetical protein [Spongiactinospora sp. TRM90649]